MKKNEDKNIKKRRQITWKGQKESQDGRKEEGNEGRENMENNTGM